MSDDLIGYVLGAVDPAEGAAIRRRLRWDPHLAKEIQQIRDELAVLALDAEGFEPPPGLSARTCQGIFGSIDESSDDKSQPVSPAGAEPPEGRGSSWRMVDVMTAAALALVVIALLMPAIANSRYHARRLYCQQQLRRVLAGLIQYSQQHHDQFPYVRPAGPLGFAGVYSTLLMDAELAQDDSWFVCPGDQSLQNVEFRVPSTGELLKAPQSDWRRLVQTAGGSFAYLLGNIDRNRLRPVRNRNRDFFPIVADAPGDRELHAGSNHAGRGLNVAFESGRVTFLTTREQWEKVFRNDLGEIAAGLGPDDAVLGASACTPLNGRTAVISGAIAPVDVR